MDSDNHLDRWKGEKERGNLSVFVLVVGVSDPPTRRIYLVDEQVAEDEESAISENI